MSQENPVLTFDELAEFIEQQMSMSHVYQPLLIRSLIDAGGAATVRQIAMSFVVNDEAVLIEAEKTQEDARAGASQTRRRQSGQRLWAGQPERRAAGFRAEGPCGLCASSG